MCTVTLKKRKLFGIVYSIIIFGLLLLQVITWTGGSTRNSSYLEDYWPFVGELSAVNAIINQYAIDLLLLRGYNNNIIGGRLSRGKREEGGEPVQLGCGE